MLDKQYKLDHFTVYGNNLDGHQLYPSYRWEVEKVLEQYQGERYEYIFAYLSDKDRISLVVFDFDEKRIYDHLYQNSKRKESNNDDIHPVITYQLKNEDFYKYRYIIQMFKNLPIIPVIRLYIGQLNFYISLINKTTMEYHDKVIDIVEHDKEQMYYNIIFNDKSFYYKDRIAFFQHLVLNYGIEVDFSKMTINYVDPDNIVIEYIERSNNYLPSDRETNDIEHSYYNENINKLVLQIYRDNQFYTDLYIKQLYRVIIAVLLNDDNDRELMIKQYLDKKIPFLEWFK
nr:MAG TPA: hypothetical protein [Caudoviricetes sp.]